MNRKILLCPSLIILLALAWAPGPSFAEDRALYVGDILTLEISSPSYTEEELRQKFQDFEILGIERVPEGYLLSLRTFDTGDKSILLGDQELVIHIASTLDDIQREGMFEGGAGVRTAGFPFHWRVQLIIAACLCALSGAFILAKFLKNRHAVQEGHYQRFLRRAAYLSADRDNFLVDLTFYFKEYIGGLYNRRIIGKTSAEIVSELEGIPALAPILSLIRAWLTECDTFKFAGGEVSPEDNRLHYERLLGIAETIEKSRFDENGAVA